MPWFENVRVAMQALWANRLRSVLTMLGLIVAISAVILVLALGVGTQKFLKDLFKNFGTNVVVIGEERGERTFRPLTMSDAEALQSQTSAIQTVAPFLDQRNVRIVWQSHNTSGRLCGITPEIAAMLNFPIVQGRFLTQTEVDERARVVILGEELSQELFRAEEPIGKEVLINTQTVKVKHPNRQTSNSQNPAKDSLTQPMLVGSSQTMTVIGVTRRVAFGYLYPLERGLMIPLPVAQELLIPSDTPFGRKVSRIFLEAKPDETIEQVTFQAVNLLKQRHQTTEQSDFFVGNAQEEINIYNNIARGMTGFLGVVAAISLLVGGINIMNIMLVSVKERTREIGLCKALGASEQVILTQFVIEALVISLIGGVLGITLGIGLVNLVAAFSPLKPEVTPLAIVLAVGVSGGVGVFFGVFPAQQAANLDPITALRTE